MTTTAPAKARLQLPVSGPTLAMVCWWLGPFALALFQLLEASGVADELVIPAAGALFSGAPVPGLVALVLAIGNAPFRRCFEGRCVLLVWAMGAGVILFLMITEGLDWPRPPHWLVFGLLQVFTAAVWLPPLRYTVRCRVASGRPGRLVTVWLVLASCSAFWLGWLLFDGAPHLAAEPARDALLRLAVPFPWLLHGIAILLLALGLVHWTLVRSFVGWAVVGYWLSLLLLAKGAPASPTTDTALVSAMAVLGLFVPLASLPWWFGRSR